MGAAARRCRGHVRAGGRSRRPRSGSRGRTRARAASKTSGARFGRRLKSPPKITRACSPAHSVAALAGPRQLLLRQRLELRGMEVGDAEPGLSAAQRHRAALRPALVQDELAGARRSRSPRVRVRFEPPSLEAIRSGVRSAIRALRRGSWLRDVSTRWWSAPHALASRRGPARRELLQQQDVPLGARDQTLEARVEVAVDLDVGRVTLRDAQQPRAPREQRRVGREVAPVEHVPCHGPYLHGRSIGRFDEALPNR